MVTLVVAGGLLAGLVLGSAPGARTAATRALGALPAPLRPDVVVLAEPRYPPSSSARGARRPPARPCSDPHPGTATDDATHAADDDDAVAVAVARVGAPVRTDRPRLRRPVRQPLVAPAERPGDLRPVPITSGRPGFRTPPGTFTVASKRRDHVSSIFNAEMPWSVFFNGGVAFHEAASP